MKVVLLAGGYGTRISEESHNKPKPMIELNGKPILMHLVDIYRKQGFRDIVILGGYRQDYIKRYFRDLHLTSSDLTIDFGKDGDIEFFNRDLSDVKVTVLNTGLDTMTGGRIKRFFREFDDEDVFLTYGDGLANVNLTRIVDMHKANASVATLTIVNPGSRFGTIVEKDGKVESFREKHKEKSGWINGGFMIVNRKIVDYIENDETVLERDPFERLSAEGLLSCVKHDGFWQCMDTLRDKLYLEDLLNINSKPWLNF